MFFFFFSLLLSYFDIVVSVDHHRMFLISARRTNRDEKLTTFRMLIRLVCAALQRANVRDVVPKLVMLALGACRRVRIESNHTHLSFGNLTLICDSISCFVHSSWNRGQAAGHARLEPLQGPCVVCVCVVRVADRSLQFEHKPHAQEEEFQAMLQERFGVSFCFVVGC
jgi:hypothetical protein